MISYEEKIIVLQFEDGTYYAKSDGSGYPRRTESLADAADFSWGNHGSIRRNYCESSKDQLIEYTRTVELFPTGRVGEEAFVDE